MLYFKKTMSTAVSPVSINTSSSLQLILDGFNCNEWRIVFNTCCEIKTPHRSTSQGPPKFIKRPPKPREILLVMPIQKHFFMMFHEIFWNMLRCFGANDKSKYIRFEESKFCSLFILTFCLIKYFVQYCSEPLILSKTM